MDTPSLDLKNFSINTPINNIQDLTYRFKFIKSVKYFHDINGSGNGTGKNILLIGEFHEEYDPNFDKFVEDFLSELIQKNKELGSCLDFFIEHMMYNLKENMPLNYDIDMNMNRLYKKLDELRLDKNNNGFRVHYDDLRYIIINENNKYNSYNYFMVFLMNIGLYYNKNDLLTNYIINTFRNIINVFLFICSVGTEEEKENGKMNYYILLHNIFYIILPYNYPYWNNNELLVHIFYLFQNEIKGISKPNIIRKQIDNIDTKYFNENDLVSFIKEKYNIYLDSDNDKTFIEDITSFYIDIYTISRMFRRFNYDKEGSIHTRCNSDENNLKNIIVYAGNFHTSNINWFIQSYVLKDSISSDIDYFDFNKKIEKKKHKI